MARSEHSGVLIPPPLIYAVPFGLGLLVDRTAPWPIGVEWHPALVGAGFVIVACGLGLIVAGIATFRRARTTIFPLRSTTRIVDRGVYRFTRNPMYVGMCIAYIGLTLVANSVWPIVALPFAVVVVDRYVMRREERYLSAQFGEQYEQYRRRVRRWV